MLTEEEKALEKEIMFWSSYCREDKVAELLKDLVYKRVTAFYESQN